MERWWENCFVDEEKINLKEIQAEKPMESLSQEEQMKISQMMFDQRQKALGLPTSEEKVDRKKFFSHFSKKLFRSCFLSENRRHVEKGVEHRWIAFSGSTIRSIDSFVNEKQRRIKPKRKNSFSSFLFSDGRKT